MLDLGALLEAISDDPYAILERFSIEELALEEKVRDEIVPSALSAGAWHPQHMFIGGFIAGLRYAEAYKLEQELGLDGD